MTRNALLRVVMSGGLFLSAATGWGEEPAGPTLEQVRAAVQASTELKARGAWTEFVAKYAEADALHQAAIESLEKQKQELTRRQDEIKALFSQAPGPEVLITAVIADVIDLDAALLETARKQARAEAGEAGTGEDGGPQYKTYTLKSEDLKTFLGTIEKRRHLNIVTRPSLITTDSRVATATVGEEIERPIGVTVTKTGEVTTQTEKATVGFTVSVVPSIESETRTSLGLVFIETSLTGKTVPLFSAADKGDVVTSPVLAARRFSTALVSEEGQTQIVALEAPRSEDVSEAPKTTLLILTAHQSKDADVAPAKPLPLPSLSLPPVRQASGERRGRE